MKWLESLGIRQNPVDTFLNSVIARLLDEVLLTAGEFDCQAAINKLTTLKNQGEITNEEYLLFVDAAAARMAGGDYTTSEVYHLVKSKFE
ncbi:MAG TPA: hypothetical protein VF209_01875 [Patescibacteria group bacterium]